MPRSKNTLTTRQGATLVLTATRNMRSFCSGKLRKNRSTSGSFGSGTRNAGFVDHPFDPRDGYLPFRHHMNRVRGVFQLRGFAGHQPLPPLPDRKYPPVTASCHVLATPGATPTGKSVSGVQ